MTIPEEWINNTRKAIESKGALLIEKLIGVLGVLGVLYGREVTENDVLLAFRAIESEIKNVSILVGQMLVDAVPKMFAFQEVCLHREYIGKSKG